MRISNANLELLYFAPFLLYGTWIVVRAFCLWKREFLERKSAPVGLRVWIHVRRLLNFSRWRAMAHWPVTEAVVKCAYPMTRTTIKRWLRIGRYWYHHPFRSEICNSCEFWFQYQVNGTGYWGNFRPMFSYRTIAEAESLAQEALGKRILIRYDPNYP